MKGGVGTKETSSKVTMVDVKGNGGEALDDILAKPTLHKLGQESNNNKCMVTHAGKVLADSKQGGSTDMLANGDIAKKKSTWGPKQVDGKITGYCEHQIQLRCHHLLAIFILSSIITISSLF